VTTGRVDNGLPAAKRINEWERMIRSNPIIRFAAGNPLSDKPLHPIILPATCHLPSTTMSDRPPPKPAPPEPAEGTLHTVMQANAITVGGDVVVVKRDKITTNITSPPPAEPAPEGPGIIMQTNAINASGDVVVVKRDKITTNITNIIHKTFLGGADEERDRRNRRVMLDKVRTFWVKGVLEQSLHGAALIELGMEYKPDAVQYPWNTVLQRPNHSSQPLPHGAKMIEVFDEEGGELLILGAPGSGKTTILLDLARDLITRAEQDETLPIPIVFNLSSWVEKHPPLADWLIEELRFRYDVPNKVGKAWIEKDQVLPLLDGLDEVKLEQRAACVEAINDFRKKHLVHLAVCSRSAEYEALRAQLRLQSAIVLQPLKREQIDTYLQSAGGQLASVYALLQHDAALQELAESPLMLSIMVLAYRDSEVSSLPTLDSPEKQRKHLFDTYIQRMFERRGADKRYAQRPQQVKDWLSWLAKRLVEHNQTTFYLERMQPTWLPTRRQRLACVILTQMIVGLSFGLIAALFIGFVSFDSNNIRILLLLIGPVLGLLAGLVVQTSEIKTVETVRWSWSGAAKSVLLGGLGVGVSMGLAFGWWGGLERGLAAGLLSGLFIGALGMLAGVKLEIGDEVETKTIPNQGMWRSVRNSILVGLGSGVAIGLITGLFDLIYALTAGLLMTLAFGLRFGGVACLAHLILRLMLCRNDSIPLNYVHFLDYCAERIFLRKVGGGYIFVHRLLMEHFAGIESLKH
jgi:GTPase SAR1 family protein